jgi:hypothetical protein
MTALVKASIMAATSDHISSRITKTIKKHIEARKFEIEEIYLLDRNFEIILSSDDFIFTSNSLLMPFWHLSFHHGI